MPASAVRVSAVRVRASAVPVGGSARTAARRWRWGRTADGTFAVARFEGDGSLDAGFASAGVAALPNLGTAYAVLSAPDGSVVAAGDNGHAIIVARFTRDGGPDPSFGNGGFVVTAFGHAQTPEGARDVLLLEGGRILVGGYASGVPNSPASAGFAMVRYDADRSLDATFGSGGVVVTAFEPTDDAGGEDLAVTTDGGLLLAGVAVRGTTRYGALARYDASGALDPSFDGDGRLLVQGAPFVSVGVQPGGRIVAWAVPGVRQAHVKLAVRRLRNTGRLLRGRGPAAAGS